MGRRLLWRVRVLWRGGQHAVAPPLPSRPPRLREPRGGEIRARPAGRLRQQRGAAAAGAGRGADLRQPKAVALRIL
eukprot:418719-Prymnesium_polylepis.2